MVVLGRVSGKKANASGLIIFAIVVLCLLAVFYGLSKNPQYHGWNIFGQSSGNSGGVRNCIKSVTTNSPECSDDDGTVKYTTLNGKYVGMCSGVTNTGECLGSGTGLLNCPSGTHQDGNNCAQNSATGSGLCSNNEQCSNFGLKNCGGAGHATCGSDSLCHCCLLVVSGGVSSCVSCTKDCAGGTHCNNGVCVFDIGGKITD